MSKRKHIPAHSQEKQEHYERVVRLQYGPETVNESVKRWYSYTQEQQEAIQQEGGQVYNDLADALEAGLSSQSAEVQAILASWHNHLRYFYEPTYEILRGLGEGYNTHPDFIAFFQKLHADLPDYLSDAIMTYVDDLEHAELERLIAEDEVNKKVLRLGDD